MAGDSDARRRADFPVLWPVPTRWSDNDHYGHVNNVAYYAFFDTAVNGWLMSASGTDIRSLPEIGLVAETGCRFLRSLSFPDRVLCGLSLRRLGRSSVTYDLGLFLDDDEDADAEPAALGHFVHVYVDRDSRRPAEVPESVRAALVAAFPAAASPA